MHDAVRLKEHILASFEAADRNPALVDDGALTLCIVGGGATGVEVAGALAELLQAEMKGDYPNLPVDRAEVHLYERGTKLLGTFKPVLQEYAKATLEKRGVRVHLGEGVAEIEPTRVRLESGSEVKAYTLVWAAGLQANSLASSFGIELVHDRVPLNADLSLKGHPEVFAAGDIAVVTDAATGRPLPQLGSVAKQAGEQAGRNLARLVRGEGTEPFRYRDRGTMATVGRGAAVVELGGRLTLTGYLAWLSWLFVHLLLLSGGIEKSLTLRDWAWNLLTRRRGKRIVVD
jgi:NADH dehydrogenase